MARRVPDQNLEQQLAAARATAARLRHEISERKRADEARRKIVIGGTIELAMADDDELRAKVLGLLRQHVTRPEDKRVIAAYLADGDSTDQPKPNGHAETGDAAAARTTAEPVPA